MPFLTSDVWDESLEGPGKATPAQKIPTLILTNGYEIIERPSTVEVPLAYAYVFDWQYA